MMALSIATQPYAEPISLAEAKDQMQMDSSFTDKDTYIAGLIRAARIHTENTTWRALVATQYRLTLSKFYSEIKLPRVGLLSVDSIAYKDSANITQTLASSVYDVDRYSEPQTIRLAYGQSWPTTYTSQNAATILFTAGHVIPFTVDADTDVLTCKGWTPVDGEKFRLSTSGTLPSGLDANADYYIINASGATCQLSTTASGSAVNVTDEGEGTHFLGMVPENLKLAIKLLVSHWYENREPVNIGNIVNEISLTVNSLLSAESVRWCE